MNKRWVKEDGGYTLYFTPFDDEIELARIRTDEDGDWFFRSGEVSDGSKEWMGESSLNEAKEKAERWVEAHYTDERNYYQGLLDKFKEET